MLEGTVSRVTDGQLLVDPGDGASPVPLRIVPGIPITVDDRVAAWLQIPEGAQVRAAWV